MKHEPTDFTRLEFVNSLVETSRGWVKYLDWCHSEVARIGPKASVRIVESPYKQQLCCVKLEGFNSGTDNE